MAIKHIKRRHLELVSGSICIKAFILITAILLTSNACFAYVSSDISWDSLNLSPEQQTRIQILDFNWQRESNSIYSQIISDKNQLKYLLLNPCSSDYEIRNLQNRIIANQSILRYQAMSNFLQKRSILNKVQRKKLHKFLLN